LRDQLGLQAADPSAAKGKAKKGTRILQSRRGAAKRKSR